MPIKAKTAEDLIDGDLSSYSHEELEQISHMLKMLKNLPPELSTDDYSVAFTTIKSKSAEEQDAQFANAIAESLKQELPLQQDPQLADAIAQSLMENQIRLSSELVDQAQGEISRVGLEAFRTNLTTMCRFVGMLGRDEFKYFIENQQEIIVHLTSGQRATAATAAATLWGVTPTVAELPYTSTAEPPHGYHLFGPEESGVAAAGAARSGAINDYTMADLTPLTPVSAHATTSAAEMSRPLSTGNKLTDNELSEMLYLIVNVYLQSGGEPYQNSDFLKLAAIMTHLAASCEDGAYEDHFIQLAQDQYEQLNNYLQCTGIEILSKTLGNDISGRGILIETAIFLAGEKASTAQIRNTLIDFAKYLIDYHDKEEHLSTEKYLSTEEYLSEDSRVGALCLLQALPWELYKNTVESAREMVQNAQYLEGIDEKEQEPSRQPATLQAGGGLSSLGGAGNGRT